jgi:Tfp pilus assembly PilM family ATPase
MNNPFSKIWSYVKNLFNKGSFGIYITDGYVQVLELKNNKGVMSIVAMGKRVLPAGVVKNGQIVQEKLLAKEINTLLAEAKPSPVKAKSCAVAVPEAQSYAHIFYLPAEMKGAELKKNLDELVENTIPLPFFQVKYAYSASVIGKVQVASVVAVKREIIAQYYDVLKTQCGLTPFAFEPESLSLYRSLNVKFEADKGVILVDLNGETANCYAYWNGSVFDSSAVDQKAILGVVNSLMKSFANNAKRVVSAIYITGNVVGAKAVKAEIEKSLKIPVGVVEKYKGSPQVGAEGDVSEYRIVAGLALKRADSSNDRKINLLEK